MNTERETSEEGGLEHFCATNKNFCGHMRNTACLLPIAFCKVDPSGRIECCSKMFKETLGYRESELLGLPILSLFKKKRKAKEFLRVLSESEGVIDDMLTLETKPEGEVSFDVSARSIYNEEGVSAGYLLTLKRKGSGDDFEREVRKRVREETAETEKEKERVKELEEVLEIRVNARTRELKEIAQLLEKKARKRMEKLEEKTREVEKKAKMEEESRVALLNLAEDLEEASKKAEEEKDKTLAIVNNFTDGLLFFNRYKELALINPQGKKIFNIEEDEVLYKKPSELKEVNERFTILMNAIEGEMKKVFRKEMSFIDEVFLEVTSVVVENEGKEMGVLVIIHDITREKKVEKLKTEFVSLAAHQLRTPLAGIKWSLGTIIEEKQVFNLDKEVMEIIERAFEANERMVVLVNDLLNVTRIEEGKYVYEPKDVDVKEIVDIALEEYKDLIESRGLGFRLEMPEETLPKIKADMEEISLVVNNFFDNALKYTKEGEVVLKVESVECGKCLKVTVSDTGVGIPEEQQESMFNKFFRAENVQLMDTDGSGLGLFISKNIIEAHGGEIGFESGEGEGSSFFFTIPTVKEGANITPNE